MRTLRLKSPRMTGPDVTDWQEFLIAQGVLDEAPDGIFGPDTAQATRDYQTAAALDADGVVGPATFHQAVLDGFTPAGGALRLGIDTNINCAPFAGCIVAAGKSFVARYYSRFPVKNITRAEGLKLAAGGLELVTVYEDGATLGTFSSARGASDAGRALTQAAALGQPAGSAIYFAVDFDPSAVEVRGPIADYFRAVNGALAGAGTPYRVGVYGSGLTCRILRDSSLVELTWLTGSTGFREYTQFRPQADILQILPDVTICGGALSIDQDVAQKADIGAFRIS